MYLDDVSKTYSEDLPLFKKLGLKPFEITDQKEHILGTYKFPDCIRAQVKITVTCMPAQFFKFEVKSEEGKDYSLTTGSGTLSQYWSFIEALADNLIDVQPLK